MIKARFGEELDRAVHKLFPFLFRRELNPNLLTLVGVALSFVAAGFLATGSFLSGGLLLLCGGFFDMADGTVARHFGKHAVGFLERDRDGLLGDDASGAVLDGTGRR